MSIKGLSDVPPLGMIEVSDEAWYFYWYLGADHSIVELEVLLDKDEHRYSRKVTAFVTKVDQVDELLAA